MVSIELNWFPRGESRINDTGPIRETISLSRLIVITLQLLMQIYIFYQGNRIGAEIYFVRSVQ